LLALASLNRFENHSLARSKIKRDGLNAGTPAPDFHLPRLDGQGDVLLTAFRGRPLIIVFSSPNCEPCNELAPKLERFHRGRPDLAVLMISKGELNENRTKVKAHGLSFPVVLQKGWTISRSYAIFATPAAYLIDEDGVIARDVAVGVEAILQLMDSIARVESKRLTFSRTLSTT
jgi:peroxiredoxin